MRTAQEPRPSPTSAARVAVATALEWLRARLAAADARPFPSDAEMTACVGATRAAVLAEAAGRGVDASDLASTLVVAVASQDGVAVAQVGDGAVVVGPGEGGLVRLGPAARAGEYLNETSFLTSAEWEESIFVGRLPVPPRRIALLTDGLQTLALRLADGAPHRPFFDPLLAYVASAPDADAASERLRAFLGGPRLRSRVDDDLTLLLAACR